MIANHIHFKHPDFKEPTWGIVIDKVTAGGDTKYLTQVKITSNSGVALPIILVSPEQIDMIEGVGYDALTTQQ